MKNNRLYKICLTGLFAAMIAVLTAFVKIPVGMNSGYIHVGDSLIYIAGCILGPLGMVASSVGGALADIMAGSAVWAFPTAIIKIFNCIPFIIATRIYKKKTSKFKVVNGYTLIMTVVSGLVTAGGYFLAEGIMYTFPTAFTGLPFSFVQAAGSGVVFVLIGKAFDSAKPERFMR